MESVDIRHLKFFAMEKCQRIMTALEILVSVWLCFTCSAIYFVLMFICCLLSQRALLDTWQNKLDHHLKVSITFVNKRGTKFGLNCTWRCAVKEIFAPGGRRGWCLGFQVTRMIQWEAKIKTQKIFRAFNNSSLKKKIPRACNNPCCLSPAPKKNP